MEFDLGIILKTAIQVSAANQILIYIVGGYVRDVLLKKQPPKDVDFVVEGSGILFARLFDKAMKQAGNLIEFTDFDTARYLLGSIIFEFAGARAEVYQENSRKPTVSSARLEQDLARRDFTVNAMAVPIERCVSSGKLVVPAVLARHVIDPCGGQADLKEKILRTPLDPNITFSDDPLRMLRAVRFAAQLEFFIEPNTLKAIYNNRERLKIVSGERVQDELLKLLATSVPSVGLALMFQTHILDSILPEISKLDGVEEIFGHQHKNNLIHSFKVADNIAARSGNVWLRLAGLLHDIGKPATKEFIPKVGWTFHAHEHVGKKMVYNIAKRLKFSKEHTDYLAKLIRWHMQPIALMDEEITDAAVRRLIVTMGDLLEDLLILGKSDITTGNPYKKEKRLKNYDRLKAKINEVIERDKLRAFQSPIRGDEIMEICKLKPGPTVGKIKEAIEEAILDGKIPNDYDAAKKYFEKIKDGYIKTAAEWEKLK